MELIHQQNTYNVYDQSSLTPGCRQFVAGSAPLQQQPLPSNNHNYRPAGRQSPVGPPTYYQAPYSVGMQHQMQQQNPAMTPAFPNPAVNTVPNGINGELIQAIKL